MERDPPSKIVKGKEIISGTNQNILIERVEGYLTVSGSENVVTIEEVSGIVLVSGRNNNVIIKLKDTRAKVSCSRDNNLLIENTGTVAPRQPANIISRPLTGQIQHSRDRPGQPTYNYQFNNSNSANQQPTTHRTFHFFGDTFNGVMRFLRLNLNQEAYSRNNVNNYFDGNAVHHYYYGYQDGNLGPNQPEAQQARAGILNEDFVIAKYGRRVQIEKTKRRPNQASKDCTVCQDTIDLAGNEGCHTDCYHWFHLNCLIPWFRENDSCPVCKKRVDMLYRPLL
jgi:hypothetical protein